MRESEKETVRSSWSKGDNEGDGDEEPNRKQLVY